MKPDATNTEREETRSDPLDDLMEAAHVQRQ